MVTILKNKVSEKLRADAARLREKYHPPYLAALGEHHATRRRQEQLNQKMRDCTRADRRARHLLAVAAAIEDGRLPERLSGFKLDQRVISILLAYDTMPSDTSDDREYLGRAGMFMPATYGMARQALLNLEAGAGFTDEEEVALFYARGKINGLQIRGFFPTPYAVWMKMAREANLNESVKLVLEPSAGDGALADQVRAACATAEIHCFEVNWELRKILELKGHHLIDETHDFMETARLDWGIRYDRVIMNPPFENGQDIEHIQQAYKLLKPDGILVAVLSESACSNSRKAYKEFRTWAGLVQRNPTLPGEEFSQMVTVPLDKGAFKESGTMTSARILVLNGGYVPIRERVAW